MVYNNKTVWNANQDSINQQSLTADTHPSVFPTKTKTPMYSTKLFINN